MTQNYNLLCEKKFQKYVSDRVPALEESDGFAAQVEVMIADVGVLARYRKRLVNLKWVHTHYNGK